MMRDLFSDVEGPLTVSQITLAIKNNLEREFASVWLTGEVIGAKKHASGHLYYTLKDAFAQLPAVIFRSSLQRVKFALKDGMEVIVRGKLGVYPPHGKYQLDTDVIEPKGIGAQELALRQLREKLLGKGYFEQGRKKKPPAFPRRIALVTSSSGAAVRDMLQVLCRRWPVGDVVVCPVRVQGDGAPGEIAATIRWLNRFHRDGALAIDVMIVGRGGGSAEDLSAFNAEIVADAIFASAIPIISAVGHEIDVSVSDHVADLHALTPTDAANKAVPDRVELISGLGKLRQRMEEAVQRRITNGRQRLDALSGRSALRRPLSSVRQREERLDELSTRLHRAIRQKSARAGQSVAALAGQLHTLSPLNVLRRGYSLTRTESSAELLRDPSLLQPGERLLTTVARGTIVSRVEEVAVSETGLPQAPG
jgi:exodeoxyribonuclease VII large subunit